jgi:AraC family transcriptional regulator, transcriptional activator of pobA
MKREKNSISEYHLNRNEPGKPQFAIYDLNDYVAKNKLNTTKPHIHSYYQIIWFKSGEGKHFVDFQEYDILKSTMLFIAKNQVHYFDEKTDYQGIMIHFNETFLVQNDSKTDFFLKYSIFNCPFQQPSFGIGSGIELILNTYISQITEELRGNDSFGKEELLRAYLKSFLIQIQRRKNEAGKHGKDMGFQNDEKRAQLIRFVNMVDENYNKGLTVSQYADLLFVSSRTLSDLTGQLLNKTPSFMIQERIILEAKRLLLHTGLNVNQICYRLGFDDASYFVKYFKKHTGTAPTEFRKSSF